MENSITEEVTKMKKSLSPDPRLIAVKIPEDSTSTEWNNWLAANLPYEHQTTNSHFYVDLQKIGDNSQQAKWLKDNSDKIDFDISSGLIYNGHRFTELEFILVITSQLSQFIISKGIIALSTIKDLIINNPEATYNNNYKHYIRFDLDKNEKDPSLSIRASVISDYDPDATCFSIPFIIAIENLHGYSVKLNFYKINLLGIEKVICSIDNRFIFLDYSHNPSFHINKLIKFLYEIYNKFLKSND